MTIYNHDIMLSTHEKYGGIHFYSGRALGLTVPGDKLQMHPALQADWDAIAGHYHRIGLTFTEDIIWDVSIEEINRHPGHDISVYFFGDAVNRRSSYQAFFEAIDADWRKAVDYINSKNNFIHLAEELNIPVPPTLCFDHQDDLADLAELPYPCYLKPSVSDHGFGIARCETVQDVQAALAQLEPDVPFQVQTEVAASAFLNLQYQTVNGRAEPVLVSEQILEGCVHGGNRYPASHEPWDIVAPMAQWLVDRGMKGIFAFDVAVVPTGDEIQYVAIECNPRFNGSSYPTGLANRLQISQWSSATCALAPRSIPDLNLAGLEFNPATGKGVILVNWGTIHAGKLSVLLAGDLEEQSDLLTKLKQRLG
ncbi:hypothetical protein [Leptolyngbya sp. PCC 6406]|uniref:hypothetical protein n=1 Tax=Leptolyngbya sp. PCC 6406 TaxID=1173264 RepID=UPI0002ACD8F9|nr:hypothetical protein [Leptolyngbya sp. PCC 6406]